MNKSEADLVAAIERAYLAFASYPLPQRLSASPLRDPAEILRGLSAAPLRELRGEDIGPYCGWAMTTVGNDRDYRHFLPRIFELAVTEPFWLGAEAPVLAGKLGMADWHSWAKLERVAVTDYFRAALDAVVTRHPDTGHCASHWLCGLVLLGEDPSAALKHWFSAASPNAALQLASFVNEQAKHWRRLKEVKGSWWDDIAAEQRIQVATGLMSDDARKVLEAAATVVSDDDRFYLIDSALIELQREA